MSAKATVKTKIKLASHIIRGAKQLGLKYTEKSDTIKVEMSTMKEVHNQAWSDVTFRKQNNVYEAVVETTETRCLNKLLQACNVAATIERIEAAGYTLTNSDEINVASQKNTVLQFA